VPKCGPTFQELVAIMTENLSAQPHAPDAAMPHRWDPLVKLTHWGIVGAILANALFTGHGSGWHIWVGYGLAALLGLRLLWGLVGPKPARFGSFPPSIPRALGHVRNIVAGRRQAHGGHNPLGALMVYAIWGCLAVVIASGIAMSGPPPADPNAPRGEETEAVAAVSSAASRYAAPVTADSDEVGEREGTANESDEAGSGEAEGGEDMMEEVHEAAVNILYLLIALHIAGVIFESMRSGPAVLGSMIPGRNRPRP